MESIPTNLEFNQSQTTETPKEKPTKSSGITVLFAALFILFSLATVAFLYYQNQQLKAMLANYQTLPSPTATATPDPTANWKVYTNPQYGISFKYPEDWLIANPKMGYFANIVDAKSEDKIILYQGQLADGIDKPNSKFEYSDGKIGGLSVRIQKNYLNGQLVQISYEFTVKDEYLILSLLDTNESKMGQILSTLMVTENSSPSPKPVACTLEAKSCPDGSYVGRVGPNCEFAACP